MSELAKRIVFAIPAAALFIWITWLGGWYFKAMMIGIGFFIQSEMIKILDGAKNPVDTLFPYTIGLWVMLSQEIPFSFEIGVGIFVLFVAVQTFNKSEFDLSELTTTVFAGLYAPIGILSLIMISSIGSSEVGFTLVMLLAFMVWGSDVLAYFGGKAFGKHALAPSISPNKTWEGFFFGYLGSAIGALAVWFLFPYQSGLTLVNLIPMALLVATFGPIGDLLESKLKRKAGVKDSSTLLPGHGGFFDRFDALILAAPVALIYLKVLVEIGNVSF
ncbi:MAG: phosphatidate cytidylyltransferase [Balneola sp.]|nr:MAG: phosphatidate cytidylyltransferase [Balneola sp.]